MYAQSTDKISTPHIPNEDTKQRIKDNEEMPEEAKPSFLEWCEHMDTGLVFLEKNDGKYIYNNVNNLHISKCFNCKKIAIWVHGNLVFPNEKVGVSPNPDLPDNVIRDFEEARGILGESPIGAAALLRLCVQRLCIHLGEKGKNIDDDIAGLVSKGLNPLVQKSLDIVRVIGNESVHPDVIDLNDHRDTASQLLVLINSIADQMISHPKNVEKLYGKPPKKKREAIEKRNDKAKPKTSLSPNPRFKSDLPAGGGIKMSGRFVNRFCLNSVRQPKRAGGLSANRWRGLLRDGHRWEKQDDLVE